jgi:hypothetical protein
MKRLIGGIVIFSRQTELKVDRKTKLKVHLAPGGGWAARIVEEGRQGN